MYSYLAVLNTRKKAEQCCIMLCMWCVIFEVFWEQKAGQIGCMVLDVVMLCVHFVVHTGNCIGASLSDPHTNHVN